MIMDCAGLLQQNLPQSAKLQEECSTCRFCSPLTAKALSSDCPDFAATAESGLSAATAAAARRSSVSTYPASLPGLEIYGLSHSITDHP